MNISKDFEITSLSFAWVALSQQLLQSKLSISFVFISIFFVKGGKIQCGTEQLLIEPTNPTALSLVSTKSFSSPFLLKPQILGGYCALSTEASTNRNFTLDLTATEKQLTIRSSFKSDAKTKSARVCWFAFVPELLRGEGTEIFQ